MFPSIPFLWVKRSLRAHNVERTAEQKCLLKPYQHRKPTCDFWWMYILPHGVELALALHRTSDQWTVLEEGDSEAEEYIEVDIVAPTVSFFCLCTFVRSVLDCGLNSCVVTRSFYFEQSRMLSLTLRLATSTMWTCRIKGGKDSTQIIEQLWGFLLVIC